MIFSSFKAMAELDKKRKLREARYRATAETEGMQGVLRNLESDILPFVGHAIRVLEATGKVPTGASNKIGEVTSQMAAELEKFFS